MRAEFPDRMTLICPAFPAQGRTVQSGVLHIHNVPWTQTEFAPTQACLRRSRSGRRLDWTVPAMPACSVAELGSGVFAAGHGGIWKHDWTSLREQGVADCLL